MKEIFQIMIGTGLFLVLFALVWLGVLFKGILAALKRVNEQLNEQKAAKETKD